VVNDAGEFVTTGELGRLSRNATKNGIVLDVRLDATGDVIAARYHGVASGRSGRILFPLQPGDEVLVVVTDGQLGSPQIAAMRYGLNATAAMDLGDWANDRVLFDLQVPLEVRAPAVSMDSPNLILNGRRVRRSQDPL
jgi:hypothetical protein